jgi:membrane protein
MRFSQIEWPVVTKAVAKEYKRDDVPGLAAEMAYHFVFALFPFVIFLATVAGMVGRLIRQDRLLDDIMNALYQQLPPETAEALRGPLEQVLGQRGNEALSIGAAVGLVLALWSASNGVATVMKSFNRAYGVEETRGFIKQKAIALGMTIVLTIFLIVGVVGLTAGNDLIEWAASVLGLGGMTALLLQGLRIVLSVVGIILAFSLLYWQGPNVDQQFRWITPGSVLSTIALALLAFGFGIYVDLVGAASYAKTYGTAFGLILFLYFLFLASQVILLGAEFNAETTKRYDPDTIRDKITDPRKQLPGEQPAPHPEAAREAGVSQGQVVATNRASAQKVAAGGGGPETATKGGAGASGNATDDGGAAEGSASVPAGVTAGATAGAGRANGATRSGHGDGQPVAVASGASAGDRQNGAPGSNGAPGGATSRTITASDAPQTRPSAEEAPRRGPDRTRLVSLAVSGMAVAGAFAMGFLRRDRDRES